MNLMKLHRAADTDTNTLWIMNMAKPGNIRVFGSNTALSLVCHSLKMNAVMANTVVRSDRDELLYVQDFEVATNV